MYMHSVTRLLKASYKQNMENPVFARGVIWLVTLIAGSSKPAGISHLLYLITAFLAS